MGWRAGNLWLLLPKDVRVLIRRSYLTEDDIAFLRKAFFRGDRPATLDGTGFISRACQRGFIGIIEWALNSSPEFVSIGHVARRGARGGKWHVLAWAIDRGYVPECRLPASAARGGHVELLEQLYKCDWKACLPSWPPLVKKQPNSKEGEEEKDLLTESLDVSQDGILESMTEEEFLEHLWGNGEVFAGGAEGGHIEVMEWAMEKSLKVNIQNAFMRAVQRGHIHVLDFVLQMVDRDVVAEHAKQQEQDEAQMGFMHPFMRDTLVPANLLLRPLIVKGINENNIELLPLVDQKRVRARLSLVNMVRLHGLNPLMWACQNNRQEVVRFLLEQGADPNTASPRLFVTPLQLAHNRHDAALMRILLSHGAHPNSLDLDHVAPLSRACCDGDLDMVSLMMETSAEMAEELRQDRSLLKSACSSGNMTLILYLLKFGIIPDDNTLASAASSGHLHVVRHLLSLGVKPGYFSFQMANLQVSILSVFLEFDVPLNHVGDFWTPLSLAAGQGLSNAVEFLVEHGCDVNLQADEGSAPVILAAREGHTYCVEYLLRNGANVNIKNNLGDFALNFAAREGSILIAEMLLKHGAEIDLADASGNTALMTASSFGRFGMVKMLLGAGANPNACCKNGTTSLMLACRAGKQELVELLVEFGQVNLQALDGSGNSALSYARGSPGIIKYLYEKGLVSGYRPAERVSVSGLYGKHGRNFSCSSLWFRQDREEGATSTSWYWVCLTCSSFGRIRVCQCCYENCHVGHDLSEPIYEEGHCNCSEFACKFAAFAKRMGRDRPPSPELF